MTRRNKHPIKVALFAALLCLSAAAQPQTITGKVVAIADGDTLTVLDAGNRQHKIRLDGIDAPESSQDWGSRAKQSLSDLVFGKTVTVISSKKDKYGRTLGKVMLDKRDINLEQIRRGMAWFYRHRNLVMHWGRTDAVALRASLRTAAPLIGEGMDRIAHAWFVEGILPLELAARASIGLALVNSSGGREIVNLLG